MVVRRASVRSTDAPTRTVLGESATTGVVNIPVTTATVCEADYSGSDAATHCARHTRTHFFRRHLQPSTSYGQSSHTNCLIDPFAVHR